jgi:hypothetical protein
LDIAYSRAVKGEWRKILSSWKETAAGSKCATIPKDQFPGLVKIVLENVKKRMGSSKLEIRFQEMRIVPGKPRRGTK